MIVDIDYHVKVSSYVRFGVPVGYLDIFLIVVYYTSDAQHSLRHIRFFHHLSQVLIY